MTHEPSTSRNRNLVFQMTVFTFMKLKECHPRCVYQIYNRLIINNDSQKHNYICKYNNLPTTCFGLISAIFRLEYSI